MTVEWFELGQRLRAAHTSQPVHNLVHAPISAAGRPVAVRATVTGDQVTVTAVTPGGGVRR